MSFWNSPDLQPAKQNRFRIVFTPLGDLAKQQAELAKSHAAAIRKEIEQEYAVQNGGATNAKIEAEVVQLSDPEERQEFLEALDLEETGLSRLIQAGYQLLGLATYFTAGPKEARAWTIKVDSKAPQAAGVIHTDFEKGFICAETIAFDDFVGLGGEVPCKEAGKIRQEGRDYTVKDGDVTLFRFNN